MAFIKSLEQVELPALSDSYHEFAEAIAKESLGRYLAVGSLALQETNGQIKWQPNQQRGNTIAGIHLLMEMRKFKKLRGSDFDDTRANLVTFGRLNAQAIHEIQADAQEKGVVLTQPALNGLRLVLVGTHHSMYKAFFPIMRPRPEEREALNCLSEAAIALGIKEGRIDASTDYI